jgi:flagellar FliL protein
MAETDKNSPESEEKSGGKGKILILVGILALLVGGGGAAYFFLMSGEESAETDLVEQTGEPEEPEISDTLYLQLEAPFLVSLLDSDQMMQVKLALRTPYGEPMINNLSAHELGIRAAFLEELAKISGDKITEINFRKDTAENLREVANVVLAEQDIYSGVDLVLFTEFLVQ